MRRLLSTIALMLVMIFLIGLLVAYIWATQRIHYAGQYAETLTERVADMASAALDKQQAPNLKSAYAGGNVVSSKANAVSFVHDGLKCSIISECMVDGWEFAINVGDPSVIKTRLHVSKEGYVKSNMQRMPCALRNILLQNRR